MGKLLVSVVLICVSVHASPFWADMNNAIQSDEDGEVDEGLAAQLMELGTAIFGQPNVESGLN